MAATSRVRGAIHYNLRTCSKGGPRYGWRVSPAEHHRPHLALVLRTAAALLVATMFMLGKLANQRGVALPEVMFWRQAVTLPMLIGWLAWHRGLHRLATTRLQSHAMRAFSGTTGMALNFGAAMLLHLSEATTLNFTAPLFAVLITALVVREHVGPWRWTAVAFGFLGVLLIARPGSTPLPALGAACGLLAALFNAVISFQIRDLSRTEEPIRVVFWFAAFGTAIAGVMLPFVFHAHDGATWAILLAIGVIGTLAQLLMTAALRFGAVASVIVMDYTQLLWATLYGRLIWGDLPAATIWLGAPLIVVAGLVIAWREHVLSRQPLHAAMAEAE
ncbi:MAG: DMT family transporter [Sphingomonadales bacterium]|nr:DMT family transporter [Sphingomonadales bacterium]